MKYDSCESRLSLVEYLCYINTVKLIAQVKLQTMPRHVKSLRETLETANSACQFVSDYAWEKQTFRQFDLHKACYREVREKFGLAAQMAVRCIGKVADAYKLDNKSKRTFRHLGSIAYDDRILSWKLTKSEVSIWTTAGRITIPFVCGDSQRELLKSRQGESDLALVDGVFYILATCDLPDPPLKEVDGVLGIDLGVVNIATDSDGNVYSGAFVNSIRHRHRRLRARLQKIGTKSAKRLLKRRRRKEACFARHENHCISKQIVATAERTNRGISLENLTGIRGRIRARKPQRAALSSWSFAQLRTFIFYKAQRTGIPVVFIDPRNTSRTCPACGCIDKANRPAQSRFSCVSCSLTGNADVFAALNIAARGRALVSAPYAATDLG